MGSFAVAPDGATIRYRSSLDASPAVVEEALSGPVLVFALALRGFFSLHASAVALRDAGDRLIAFVGPSGAGKSTLAAVLAARGPWVRVSDDVLPAGLTEEPSPVALTEFPQPKLAATARPAASLPESLPLAAVCVLRPPTGEVRLAPMPVPEAALTLIRHTLGTRLFGPDLLRRHLDSCADLAVAVPVVRLSYPWTSEGARCVSDALRERFGAPS